MLMSRKTSRNATKNARKRPPTAGRSRISLSGLALGSLTFAVGGALHAQNASSPTATENAKVPRASSGARRQASKRPGNPGALRLASSAAQNVPAPTTGAAALQEIVVTGIRGSLERALQIKRMSLGVVDAISAEDIGQFPDSSIGEAMQRIPGVSISRGVSSTGNTSIGNATGITVRGFGPDFNETLVDGRPVASALTNSREFDFSAVGAEFVGEIDVHKTPDFSLSTGDIGATVNIKYPKPFDHPGMHASAFGSTTDYQLDGQFTPAFGGLWSDTFGHGRFGILLDGDYTDHKIVGHHVSSAGWEGTYLNSCQMAGGPACAYDAKGNLTTPANAFPSWFIQEYQVFLERTDERRKDGRAVFQWHPADAVMVTLNDDYADDRIVTNTGGFSAWFNSNALSNVTQDGNGTITDFSYGPAPTDLDAGVSASYIKTNTYGLNVLWDVNDDWSAEVDASQSVARLNPGGQYNGYGQDVGYGPSTPAGTNGYVAGIADTGASDLLYPTGFGPNNDAANLLDTALIGSHVFVIQQQQNRDTVNQAKLDATWHHDSTKVNFGAQFVGETRNQMEADDFTNNQWQLFAGYGPASNNYTYMCGATPCKSQTAPPAGAVKTPDGMPLPASLFTGTFSTANFIPGWGNSNLLPPNLLWYSPYAVTAYEQSQGVAGANASWTPASGYPQYTGTVVPAISPSSTEFVQEKSYAPFVTAEQNFRIASMQLKADLGLRYDRTDVTSGGIERLPTALQVEPSDHTAFLFSYTPSQFVTTSNSYHYLLPSLDLNLMVRRDLKVRLDLSRTETKPPISDITPALNVNGRVGALVATGNNPDLLPYLSDNLDLGAEWYYAPNDYLSVDGFFKHVSQFPVNQTIITTINGVTDPTTGQIAKWAETTFLNGPTADVRGLEVGWQQMLWGGFGLQVNGTIVGTNAPYNRYALTNVFAVTGLSNSANFVGFYQHRGFQARVAVNWRGEELNAFGQAQNNSQFGTEPTYVNAQTEVDFSTSYDINSHLSVFFEGLNLNDGVYSTHGRFSNQVLDVVEYGRSFTMGVRAKM
jgi:iron complex outermembrane receptor protein